ncbi:hypothetical protein CAEBREN_02217 [Caenorhabditis brenneri]|uniref:Uncharacterized protein n=1 Tax=Caenorhabditis brenneri TaxID=135651 RepID=G0MYA7_CAEBE|nr:hypothetical protein CAEBREN_02217 [Caenorhabditis brenneri]
MQPIEVKKEVDPEDHGQEKPVRKIQPNGGRVVKAEVVEEEAVEPVVEFELNGYIYDTEMLKVAHILLDMPSIHKSIESKKRRKIYAANYRKKKAAEKKAIKEGATGRMIKMEIDQATDHSYYQAGQSTTFFGATNSFHVNTIPLNLN